MDREKIVALARSYYLGSPIAIERALSLISEYCLERGKSEADTSRFIKSIVAIGNIWHYFATALSWYEKKFSIMKVESKPDDKENRKILLIR